MQSFNIISGIRFIILFSLSFTKTYEFNDVCPVNKSPTFCESQHPMHSIYHTFENNFNESSLTKCVDIRKERLLQVKPSKEKDFRGIPLNAKNVDFNNNNRLNSERMQKSNERHSNYRDDIKTGLKITTGLSRERNLNIREQKLHDKAFRLPEQNGKGERKESKHYQNFRDTRMNERISGPRNERRVENRIVSKSISIRDSNKQQRPESREYLKFHEQTSEFRNINKQSRDQISERRIHNERRLVFPIERKTSERQVNIKKNPNQRTTKHVLTERRFTSEERNNIDSERFPEQQNTRERVNIGRNIVTRERVSNQGNKNIERLVTSNEYFNFNEKENKNIAKQLSVNINRVNKRDIERRTLKHRNQNKRITKRNERLIKKDFIFNNRVSDQNVMKEHRIISREQIIPNERLTEIPTQRERFQHENHVERRTISGKRQLERQNIKERSSYQRDRNEPFFVRRVVSREQPLSNVYDRNHNERDSERRISVRRMMTAEHRSERGNNNERLTERNNQKERHFVPSIRNSIERLSYDKSNRKTERRIIDERLFATEHKLNEINNNERFLERRTNQNMLSTRNNQEQTRVAERNSEPSISIRRSVPAENKSRSEKNNRQILKQNNDVERKDTARRNLNRSFLEQSRNEERRFTPSDERTSERSTHRIMTSQRIWNQEHLNERTSKQIVEQRTLNQQSRERRIVSSERISNERQFKKQTENYNNNIINHPRSLTNQNSEMRTTNQNSKRRISDHQKKERRSISRERVSSQRNLNKGDFSFQNVNNQLVTPLTLTSNPRTNERLIINGLRISNERNINERDSKQQNIYNRHIISSNSERRMSDQQNEERRVIFAERKLDQRNMNKRYFSQQNIYNRRIISSDPERRMSNQHNKERRFIATVRKSDQRNVNEQDSNQQNIFNRRIISSDSERRMSNQQKEERRIITAERRSDQRILNERESYKQNIYTRHIIPSDSERRMLNQQNKERRVLTVERKTDQGIMNKRESERRMSNQYSKERPDITDEHKFDQRVVNRRDSNQQIIYTRRITPSDSERYMSNQQNEERRIITSEPKTDQRNVKERDFSQQNIDNRRLISSRRSSNQESARRIAVQRNKEHRVISAERNFDKRYLNEPSSNRLIPSVQNIDRQWLNNYEEQSNVKPSYSLSLQVIKALLVGLLLLQIFRNKAKDSKIFRTFLQIPKKKVQ